MNRIGWPNGHPRRHKGLENQFTGENKDSKEKNGFLFICVSFPKYIGFFSGHLMYLIRQSEFCIGIST